MVRDDFWLAVSRLLRDLEIRLVEGRNSAPADLFDLDHARKVLAAFGRAFGKLPEKPGETTRNQAARAVLKDLLPDSGMDIKGSMRAHAELLDASGYGSRLKDFEDALLDCLERVSVAPKGRYPKTLGTPCCWRQSKPDETAKPAASSTSAAPAEKAKLERPVEPLPPKTFSYTYVVFPAGAYDIGSVNLRLIDQGINSFWAICVDYLCHTPGRSTGIADSARPSKSACSGANWAMQGMCTILGRRALRRAECHCQLGQRLALPESRTAV